MRIQISVLLGMCDVKHFGVQVPQCQRNLLIYIQAVGSPETGNCLPKAWLHIPDKLTPYIFISMILQSLLATDLAMLLPHDSKHAVKIIT